MAGARSLHYSHNMNKIIVLGFVVISCPAAAVVCKSIDAEGRVTYSDVPLEHCEQRIELPPAPARSPADTPNPQASQAQSMPGESTFPGYARIAISQPGASDTVRSEEGRVPVSLSLQPELQTGHAVRWELDGVQVLPPFEGPSAILTGVSRGSHSLRAEVIDGRGAVLLSAGPVRFTLRKQSIEEAGQGSGLPGTPPN